MASLDATDLNETFDLLTHPHRRYVLYYLTREFEAVAIDTLAAAIAGWDADHTGPIHDSTAVEAALHHTHLPKLREAGIITFGPDGETIELDETGELEQFLAEAARVEEV